MCASSTRPGAISMMPRLKRGVSAVRARNSTLPTRWPAPGETTIGRASIGPILADAVRRSGLLWPRDELEARADAVLDERAGEAGGERVGGAPAGAVRGHQVVRGERDEGVAGGLDDRLERGPAEVEAPEGGVEAVLAGGPPDGAG